MCMFFEICEKRPFQKCMGWGGGGGHSFAHRAVQGRAHRAQAMVQGSLIIPNPIRCHRCPFLQGPASRVSQILQDLLDSLGFQEKVLHPEEFCRCPQSVTTAQV